MTEVLSAIAGAFIGVILTYIFDIRKTARERTEAARDEERRRQEARRATATALLFDLKRLEFDLRQIYRSENPTRAVTYDGVLFYKSLYPELRWFEATSIQPVAEFFRRSEHFYLGLASYRQLTNQRAAADERQKYTFRCYAAFALQALPAAAHALQNEGGISPAAIDWPQYTQPHVPPIPEAIFPDRATDVPALSGSDGAAT